MEPIGWWAPAVRLGTRFSFRDKFNFTPRFSYTVERLHCGADRVVAPSGSRQYLSVCRRDFPMQGDVAPKVRNGSKTFMRIPSVGSVFVRTSHGGYLNLFVIKVLEFLKPFSKGFKWVWAKPTASSLATFISSPASREQRLAWLLFWKCRHQGFCGKGRRRRR